MAVGVHVEHETAGSRKESGKRVAIDKRTSPPKAGHLFIKSKPSEVLLDHRMPYQSDYHIANDALIQPGWACFKLASY